MIGRTNTGGGGGSGLNFKVVGGTTAPTNPKENMIWVNTDQKITSWIFSATEPTEPIEGMVWIIIGTSSAVEFDALKKNGIQVYPISAKQYVSGALAAVEAKSYQNGVWVDWWNGELYDHGDEYENITGGWTSDGYTCGSDSLDTVTKSVDHILLGKPVSGVKRSIIGTSETVSIPQKVKTICVEYAKTNYEALFSVRVCETKDISNYLVAANHDDATVVDNVLMVDVSGVAGGDYYISLDTLNNGSTYRRQAKIYKVRFE